MPGQSVRVSSVAHPGMTCTGSRFRAANDHIVTATGFHPTRRRHHPDERNRRRQRQPVKGGEGHKYREETFADWDATARYPDFWSRTSKKFLELPRDCESALQHLLMKLTSSPSDRSGFTALRCEVFVWFNEPRERDFDPASPFGN